MEGEGGRKGGREGGREIEVHVRRKRTISLLFLQSAIKLENE